MLDNSVPCTPLEHHELLTNGIRLHVVQAGPADGPVAILLHGFPEFWMGWSNQIDALATAGYRIWIPDQRGYNTSEKPRDVASYALDVLVDDVRGLIHLTGHSRVVLLAHDWGGAVAWRLAQNHPELIERLIVCNCPHPQVLLQQLKSSPRQLLRSWYMLFFQLPRLPEYLLGRRNCALLRQSLLDNSKPGTFSKHQLQKYREAWQQPGTITGMVNWYRALLRIPLPPPRQSRITTPTLLIWGKQDFALGSELAQLSIDLCDSGRLEFIDDAGHWLLHEATAQVNELLVATLKVSP